MNEQGLSQEFDCLVERYNSWLRVSSELVEQKKRRKPFWRGFVSVLSLFPQANNFFEDNPLYASHLEPAQRDAVCLASDFQRSLHSLEGLISQEDITVDEADSMRIHAQFWYDHYKKVYIAHSVKEIV